MTSLDEVSKLFHKVPLEYKTIRIIDLHCKQNRETLVFIRSLPHEKIPIEMDSSYMGILARVELINTLFNSALISGGNKNSKEQILKDNDKNLNSLFEEMNLFKEFVIEQKEKLNELN
ncbi:hypothetical protein SAMN05877753_10388 [Bacillus oleivorans]|uniref:Uncharacterized protein n=1 Tax=Bacillus oleivorans TaxID=1448271 RepID=A0A285CR13_9BACI|nr:hypothetical protein [Bacillus oleivorans]SNX69508.1 hypothetical protein SAMN05877753_10388 [Bacillus oleivorans]